MTDADLIVGWQNAERSRGALELGALYAGLVDANVTVAHVFSVAGVFHEASLDYEREEAELASEVLFDVSQLPESLQYQEVALRAHSAAEGLHELAERERAELVIVGSTRQSVIGRVFAGDTARALLHGAPCPISVAPNGYHAPAEGFQEIAVAFDAREGSRCALRAGVSLATLAGAKLRLLAVAEPPGVEGVEVVVGVTYDSVMAEIRKERQAGLDEGLASLPGALPAEGELLEGDAAKALSEAAGNLDLLVVGSRGYGPLKRVLLGSTSGRLADEAPCPILAIPRGFEWTLSTSG